MDQREAAAADRILALLAQSAEAEYIGEPISQLAHALQAAALADAAGAPDVEVLAALLHDIGHLCAPSDAPRMAGLGVDRHEEVGADYLAQLGVAADVTELVRGHVAAKRYLVATNPSYATRLSDASRGTLAHQGGPMAPAECEHFARDPRAAAWQRLRAWDEQAKIPELPVPGLESYRARLLAALRRA